MSRNKYRLGMMWAKPACKAGMGLRLHGKVGIDRINADPESVEANG